MRHLLFPFIFIASALDATAQSPQNVADSLKNKTVLLRVNSAEDKLAFDAQGNSTQASTPLPFALSAMLIKNADVSDQALEVEGTRVLLVTTTPGNPVRPESIRALPLEETKVIVTINLDSRHLDSLKTAIEKVFAVSPAEILSAESPEERQRAFYTLASLSPSKEPAAPRARSNSDLSLGVFSLEGVTLPHLATAPSSAPFSMPHSGANGTCLLSITIDRNGFPVHARVERSLEPTFDRKAVEDLSRRRFVPASLNGKALAVRTFVEFSFHKD